MDHADMKPGQRCIVVAHTDADWNPPTFRIGTQVLVLKSAKPDFEEGWMATDGTELCMVWPEEVQLVVDVDPDEPGQAAEREFFSAVCARAHVGNPDWHAVCSLLLAHMRPCDVYDALYAVYAEDGNGPSRESALDNRSNRALD